MNAVMAFAGIVAGILLAEAGLRLVAPQIPGEMVRRPHPPGMYVSHPVLGHRLAPGFEGRFERSEEGISMDLQVNSLGIRGPEPRTQSPGGKRVLLLGDSFTFGWGLPFEESYGARLETILARDLGRPVDVIPMGTPGYDTETELSWLREIGWSLDPDLVVLQFCVSNDFSDNLLPNFEVRDGFLHRPNRKTATAGAHDAPSGLADWLGRKSHLYVFISSRYRSLGKGRGADFKIHQARRANREYAVSYDRTAAILGDFAAEAAGHGVPLAVFNAPVKYQVADSGAVPQDLLLEANGKIRDACDRLGVPFIDATADFQREGTGLFLEKDAHWSAAGHARAAEILARKLLPLLTEEGAGS
jgi:lysophospholipase L1-like esterase